MALRNQWDIIKQNWLIALLVIALALFSFAGNIGSSILNIGTTSYSKAGSMEAMDTAVSSEYRMAMPYYPEGDFAPEAEQRQIIKTATLRNQVDRGQFSQADSRLRAIVASSDSFILNENINTYDQGWKEYKQGYYQLKVEAGKYSSVLSQLREIGEVQSFNENSQDVTGRYTDLNVELAAEKERLARYRSMYSEAVSIEDKINLNDRIFDQERRVKYLEESIKNIDKRVEYSTISFTLSEKSSDYTGIAVIKLSQLIRNLVNSFNSLLSMLFRAIPYAIAAAIVWVVYRAVRKKRK